ncbi:MAG TPA: hypothetical protein VLE89_03460 [Chlamydiales bacterium]|nr:hypothetical protein [Chlamydiales bacterium]
MANLGRTSEMNRVTREIADLQPKIEKTTFLSASLKWANNMTKCKLLSTVAIGASTAAASNAFPSDSLGRITFVFTGAVILGGGCLWSVWRFYKNGKLKGQIRQEEKKILDDLSRLNSRRTTLKTDIVPELQRVEKELDQIEKEIQRILQWNANLLPSSNIPISRIVSAQRYNDSELATLEKRREELLEKIRALKGPLEDTVQARVSYAADDDIPPPPPEHKEVRFLLPS